MVAQEIDSVQRKTITISRIFESPDIDGRLTEPFWASASVATDFVERMPDNLEPVPDSLKTEVRIAYDDKGIYFGAKMFDPEPGKIRKELTQRDGIGNDDFFFILLNGYNDHQQSMQFIVTAAGVQYDAKMTNMNEDPSWNGVWYSAVEITKFGWVAEIFIPYSELRFPDKEVQVWGLQMEREVRRIGSRFSWSPVNTAIGSFSIYDGKLLGISDIRTPVRLSLQPYLSTYINHYQDEATVSLNGGMDLKYGINDAFTLDMILVPDFGQTKFDETVLNLSAFEVQYDEQRPFFTEGTELFSKGELFYSRRVGGAPEFYPDLQEHESIKEYPANVDLINALKISGRTNGGLGVGFFNALTENAFATIENTQTGEVREEKVAPFTDYNILVLDQRFGENSSVALVNTNTLREGHFRDANATGAYLDLTNKRNTFNYRAGVEGSWVMDQETRSGLEAQAEIEKISGKNRGEVGVEIRTEDYDIDDLGYTGLTNYAEYHAAYGYRLLKPSGLLNNMFLNFNLFHKRRLDPDLFSELVFNFNSSFTTKDFFNFGGGFETTPFGTQDFYEPRVKGYHFDIPTYYDFWVWFGTDRRKAFNLQSVVDWYKYDEKGRGRLNLEFVPAYRISDQFNLQLMTNVILSDKEEGFVDLLGDDILFGRRDRNTIVNSVSANYIFNNRMDLNLSFRHYYSEVYYSQIFTLEHDGKLSFQSPSDGTYDTTFNSWNLDLRFSWWFAPGSQLSVLYRNATESNIDLARINFRDNFDILFRQPQVNNLSMRVTYFLDYSRIRNWFSRSTRNSIIEAPGPKARPF